LVGAAVSDNAQYGLEGLGACRAQCVGDAGGAVGVVSDGDFFYTGGVFGGNSATLLVVSIGGKAVAVFVRDAG
jgi:hypothetical protein